jgi:tRNA-splicing ligase RtcB
MEVGTESAEAYLSDLRWALDFARTNRESIAARALDVIGDFLAVSIAESIDVHHNFVARERWFGRDVYVHRKGAVAVPEGTLALIPGSMGTASYIVEGLGSEDSFGSCSHGAGRVMSRKEARAAIRPDALRRAMRRIVYPEGLSADLVEEAPPAYRDIGAVLADQEDLVRRRRRLEPVAVLKG